MCNDSVSPINAGGPVYSLFCSKGTQDSWSVPRDDAGHLGHNGIPKDGGIRPRETAELVPQVVPQTVPATDCCIFNHFKYNVPQLKMLNYKYCLYRHSKNYLKSWWKCKPFIERGGKGPKECGLLSPFQSCWPTDTLWVVYTNGNRRRAFWQLTPNIKLVMFIPVSPENPLNVYISC